MGVGWGITYVNIPIVKFIVKSTKVNRRKFFLCREIERFFVRFSLREKNRLLDNVILIFLKNFFIFPKKKNREINSKVIIASREFQSKQRYDSLNFSPCYSSFSV